MINKPFFAEPVPKDKKLIVCAAESLCSKIMCAPKDATIEEVERAAGVAGTTRGWKVEIERDDHKLVCKDDPERIHWLLMC